MPAFEKLTDVQDLGRGRAAEGHALSLSQPAQPSDPVDRGGAGAAEDRRADLHAGRPDQDDRPAPAGRADGEDARLGRERGRRLHAQLSASQSAPCRPRTLAGSARPRPERRSSHPGAAAAWSDAQP